MLAEVDGSCESYELYALCRIEGEIIFVCLVSIFVALAHNAFLPCWFSWFQQGVLDGKFDDLSEQSFYMVGGIDEVIAKAEKIAKESAS